MAGYPLISVPAGFVEGLPVGITFMGPAFGEPALIRWLDRSCEVLDVTGLMEVAGWDGPPQRRRPLI